jgi:peptidoglycan/LPS O-acetylase OafA/YrhL
LLIAIAIGFGVFHRSHDLFVFQFIIGLPLTIAVSALSYRYFESPFLKLKERFTIVRSRAV